MQRLVTIDLKASNDGTVQEHLTKELEDGWRVISASAAGAGQETFRSFLVVVALER